MKEINIEQCLDECTKHFGDSKFAPLAVFLGMTEALQMMLHSHHWETQGPEFFADHQLFAQLYTAMDAHIDQLGERTVGLSKEPKLVNYFSRMKVKQKFLETCTTPEPYMVVSLAAEKAYIAAGEKLMDRLKEAGLLTRGLEQLLGNILDVHETHVYLLDQRTKGML